MHSKTIKTKNAFLVVVRKKYTVSLIAMTKFKTFPKIFLIATMGISKCPQVNCDFMRALLKVKFAHPEKFDLKPHKRLDFLSLRWNLGRMLRCYSRACQTKIKLFRFFLITGQMISIPNWMKIQNCSQICQSNLAIDLCPGCPTCLWLGKIGTTLFWFDRP